MNFREFLMEEGKAVNMKQYDAVLTKNGFKKTKEDSKGAEYEKKPYVVSISPKRSVGVHTWSCERNGVYLYGGMNYKELERYINGTGDGRYKRKLGDQHERDNQARMEQFNKDMASGKIKYPGEK